MDERHGEIRTGAGLEESRVNREFIDFLKKWSTPVLFVVAAVLLGFVVYQRVEQARLARVDEAFAALEGGASPESLRGIAQDYEGVRGVGVLARLEAADQYLSALRRGVKAGAVVSAQGEVENEEDLLDEATRELYLVRAEELFQEVLRKAQGKAGWEIHEINALFGLAAVAESRRDFEGARTYYERAAEAAERAGFAPQDEVARMRIASLDDLSEPKIYEEDELPELPWAAGEPGPVGPLPPAPAGPQGTGEGTGADAGAGVGGDEGSDEGAGETGDDAPPPG